MTTFRTFKTEKGPTEKLDLQLSFATEFAKDDPADVISGVVWAVTGGSVTLTNERIVGTDIAIARVEGGTKLYSWHSVKATVTCVSGQVYVRTIEIQLVRT